MRAEWTPFLSSAPRSPLCLLSRSKRSAQQQRRHSPLGPRTQRATIPEPHSPIPTQATSVTIIRQTLYSLDDRALILESSRSP